MDGKQNDIRGVLIGVTGARLLLPNASVAEVITYSLPEPVPNAPDWLYGRIRWRGWRLPLISFAKMAGLARGESELGAKVVVLKALGGNPRQPYFAMLTQGFPRLVTVPADQLMAAGDGGELPPGVLQPVLLRDDEAVIPDLAAIEQMVVDALAVSAQAA
ncbi:chemotaxis protein CheW [Chiayiivirga flava]|uniref:Chemosensory pili system protein ChpC n=1 Tax=Chiayiivirga flava TaxID=659595 RepID=A0A7W8D3I4_9GAMM|nr:chemotaxis protein CheW [Chiayiivirga flava]MBB5207244.1 chemosensory pili system protein ChpC [Chiayiivirga flava]